MGTVPWEDLKHRGVLLLCALAMAAVCFVFTRRAVHRLRIHFADWPRTEATVRAHSKIRESFDRRPLGSATVTYEYAVDGATHRGEVAFDQDPLATVKDFVKAHPVGSTLPVFYDPGHPARSVTDRGLGAGTFGFLALGILGALAAVALLWSAARRARPDEPSDEPES